mgnify:CR=1 FL=1
MNFLIANKLWLVVIGALAGVMLGLGVEIWKLKGDVKDAKAGLMEAQKELAIKESSLQISAANLNEKKKKIDLQNAKFKELEVKKPDVKKTQERVKRKFESIKPLAAQNCEERLERCERIFDELAR